MNSNSAISEQNALQFYRQYSANALLPELDWQKVFGQSELNDVHLRALNTLYQAAVPLALKVFHELNFDVFFSMEELLELQAGYYGLKRRIAKERVGLMLEQFGLTEKRKARSRELSGGMKRRVQIAKALVHDPPILILDEPTAGVDIELRHMLWDYLKTLNNEGKTILLTTHYIEEAEKLCDEIAIINNGQIIKQGDTKSIIKEVSLNTIEIEVENPNNLNLSIDQDHILTDNILKIHTKEVNKNMLKIINQVEQTTTIKNINIIKSSLEDAFLKLTN